MSESNHLDHIHGSAIVLTNGKLSTDDAKTAHGLIRGSSRFQVLGIVDPVAAGRDAGELLDGRHRGIPVFADVDQALAAGLKPKYVVVGVALSGGRLPEDWNQTLTDVLNRGLSVVNSMHQLLADHPVLAAAAKRTGARIYDIRRPKDQSRLHFWTGGIFNVKTPRVAVLGTDCSIGKRTTCRLVMDMCRAEGIRAEMIYTGQTGWMQGAEYGFIFDATLNDFVSGELERAVLECDRHARPELMLIEGQSSLRNPSGPCGSELIVSADAKGVILQHAPLRRFFDDQEHIGTLLPDVASEIELIRLYGAEVLAVTVNRAGGSALQLADLQADLERRLNLPVVDPLAPDQLQRLMPILRSFLTEYESLRPITRLDGH
jgi:uncharacterized NAD-dependent epimerase/dehydratase family protein